MSAIDAAPLGVADGGPERRGQSDRLRDNDPPGSVAVSYLARVYVMASLAVALTRRLLDFEWRPDLCLLAGSISASVVLGATALLARDALEGTPGTLPILLVVVAVGIVAYLAARRLSAPTITRGLLALARAGLPAPERRGLRQLAPMPKETAL